MKKPMMKTIFFLLLLFWNSNTMATSHEERFINQKIKSFDYGQKAIESFTPFVRSKELASQALKNEAKTFCVMDLDTFVLRKILKQKNEFIEITIPNPDHSQSIYRLYLHDIKTVSFQLITSDEREYEQEEILHYRGIVDGDSSSICSFSFASQAIMGFSSNSLGNKNIGKIKNENRHVVFYESDLIKIKNYTCSALGMPSNTKKSELTSLTTNCVNFYYEIDYDVYVDKGSVSNVNFYIQGLFNQVSTLYANDGIDINLSTVFVWTSQDPYVGPTTLDYLNQFGNYRTSFNGDLAHLIGYSGGGGIAYLDGLCNPNQFNRVAYSDINSTYQAVPAYSWSVHVVAHEQGHLLGSSHTHDCVWNGNNTAIDGCGVIAGYASGSCPTAPLPSNGGTIMSYCHLVSGVGVNFSKGFGVQPRSLMISNVNSASCLNPCTPCPQKPDTIIGQKRICLNSVSSSVIYTCPSVPNASSYIWTMPSGWVGVSNLNSLTVTSFGSSGRITVMASNSCGVSQPDSLYVTVKNVPSKPTTIKGYSNGVCLLQQTSYSVNSVQNVNYYWSFNTNKAIITAGQGTASINTSFNQDYYTGTLSVTPFNECGSGTQRALTINSYPSTPKTIIGNAFPCSGQLNVPYQITPVFGATLYEWGGPWKSTLNAGGVTSTNNFLTTSSNLVYVNFGNNTGKIKVKSTNSCGSSQTKYLSISFPCKEQESSDKDSYVVYSEDGTIKIMAKKSEAQKSKLQIFDTQGKIIQYFEFTNSGQENIINLPLDGVSTGIYFVTIQQNKEIETLKIAVKQ